MHFDTSKLHLPGTILLLHVLYKLGSHNITMCSSSATRTMAADANQLLVELRDFLRAGDDDLAGRFINPQNLLRVVNAENKDLHVPELPKDNFRTSLMSVIIMQNCDKELQILEEVAKGNYKRTCVCLTVETMGLKGFVHVIHFQQKVLIYANLWHIVHMFWHIHVSCIPQKGAAYPPVFTVHILQLCR